MIATPFEVIVEGGWTCNIPPKIRLSKKKTSPLKNPGVGKKIMSKLEFGRRTPVKCRVSKWMWNISPTITCIFASETKDITEIWRQRVLDVFCWNIVHCMPCWVRFCWHRCCPMVPGKEEVLKRHGNESFYADNTRGNYAHPKLQDYVEVPMGWTQNVWRKCLGRQSV